MFKNSNTYSSANLVGTSTKNQRCFVGQQRSKLSLTKCRLIVTLFRLLFHSVRSLLILCGQYCVV